MVDVKDPMLCEGVQEEFVQSQFELKKNEHLIEKGIDEAKIYEEDLKELEEILSISPTSEILAQPCSQPTQKLTDPGGFYIPITLGDLSKVPALCDVGAAVRILPLFFLKYFGSIGKLVPTRFTLNMADGSTSIPKGMLIDVSILI